MSISKFQKDRERITNRTIARLLARLTVPQKEQDDIKRAMWFLSDDIDKLITENKDKQG